MFVKQTSHPAFVSTAYGFELPLSAPLLLLGPSHTLTLLFTHSFAQGLQRLRANAAAAPGMLHVIKPCCFFATGENYDLMSEFLQLKTEL